MRRQLLILLLFIPLPAFSQTHDKQAQAMRDKRYSMIHVHHVGIGAGAAMLTNLRASARVYYGFGSYRNLANVDAGVKYTYCYPLLHTDGEKVAGHYVSPFVAATLNCVRWERGSMYIGGEAAYNFGVAADHYIPATSMVEHDRQAVAHHCSVQGKIGVRLEHWDIGVHFEYDLAPAYNQKYIFETPAYDYYSMHSSLFERYRVGLNAAYLIPL